MTPNMTPKRMLAQSLLPPGAEPITKAALILLCCSVLDCLAQPTATTGSAANITADTAWLRGTVNPEGRVTATAFAWGRTTSYGQVTPIKNVGAAGSYTTVAVSNRLTGLSVGTTYHFRLFASNTLGVAFGSDRTFTTDGPPSVTTAAATEVSQFAARLNATVDPGGGDTAAYFEYGETAGYGQLTPVQQLGAGTTPLSLTAVCEGLLPETTYYFRAVASNYLGKIFGAPLTFTTTSSRPEIVLLPEATIGPRSAVVNISVNAHGVQTACLLDWGMNSDFGKVTPSQIVGSSEPVPLTFTIGPLLPDTSYVFRATAENSYGIVSSPEWSFRTPRLTEPAMRHSLAGGRLIIEVPGPNGESVDIEEATTLGGVPLWSYVTTVRAPGTFQPPPGAAGPRFYRAAAIGNHIPALALSDRTVDEGSNLTFAATTTHPDPEQQVAFALGPGAPEGATIDASSGAFSWTPSEAQGPGQYSITVLVSDNVMPPGSGSASFTARVNEVNRAPVLEAIENQTGPVNQPITFTATAGDPDVPLQALTYSLEPGAPAGASINPSTGVFTWIPSAPGTFQITVRVTDNGTPSLSDAKAFSITTVFQNQPPIVSITAPTAGTSFLVPTDITLTAAASDSDGSVSKVEFFYAEGGLFGRTGKIGEDTSEPYTIVWANALAGSFGLTAVAYDNQGAASTSAVVNITVRNRPQLTGSSDSSGNVFLQWTFDWGTLVSTQDGYELQESSTSATSGFVTIWSTLNQNDHQSPRQYATPKPAGTYWYRVRARILQSFSEWSNVARVQVQQPARQITLHNNMPTSIKLHEVVQVKLSSSSAFGRGDLLTDDPARCLSLPGESIAAGRSQSFPVSLTPPYYIFIGIGIWDTDNFFCGMYAPFFKCRYFVTPEFDTYYVWQWVQVTSHSGNWDWTISGSYLNGTLAVTPDGEEPIPFAITSYDPIP